MIVVLMGVSGCGKTTVGTILGRELGWRFIEGNDHHPPANVAKMAGGHPLTDTDRLPWLDRLHDIFADLARHGQSAVVACSALKRSYRERLAQGIADIRFVYLRGSRDLIAGRLGHRTGHYMPPALLDSQFEALEEPDHDVVTVDIGPPPSDIAGTVRSLLGI